MQLRKCQTALEQARQRLDSSLRKKFFLLTAKIGARRRAVGQAHMRPDVIVLLDPVANCIPHLRPIHELAQPGAFASYAGEHSLSVSVVPPVMLAAMRLWRSSTWNLPAA